jgi:hypothetical protein
VATMRPEELQERVNELEEEAEHRERAVEALQMEVAAVEARLEEALRAKLRADQDRELGHKIEQQMQFRDNSAAADLEALADGPLSQDPAKLAEDRVELVVTILMVTQRLHELANLLRKPILTLSIGKPEGEGE